MACRRDRIYALNQMMKIRDESLLAAYIAEMVRRVLERYLEKCSEWMAKRAVYRWKSVVYGE